MAWGARNLISTQCDARRELQTPRRATNGRRDTEHKSRLSIRQVLRQNLLVSSSLRRSCLGLVPYLAKSTSEPVKSSSERVALPHRAGARRWRGAKRTPRRTSPPPARHRDQTLPETAPASGPQIHGARAEKADFLMGRHRGEHQASSRARSRRRPQKARCRWAWRNLLMALRSVLPRLSVFQPL